MKELDAGQDKNSSVKVQLKTPEERFNPRIIKIKPDDERFFAYESQKSHH